MHQRRQVDHLDDHRHPHMRIRRPAKTARRQRHQRRPQMFPRIVQRMLGIRNDLRIKLPRLLHQLLRHRSQERLHWFSD